MHQINKTALVIFIVNVVLCGASIIFLLPLGMALNPFSAPEPGLVELTRYERYTVEPAWSPDGRWIVFESQLEDPNPEKYAGHASELYVIAVDGTHRKRITYSQRAGGQPAWSPDGQTIAFTDGTHICLMHPDGSRLACTPIPNAERLAWAPDGKSLAYDAGGNIYRLAVDAEMRRLLLPPVPVRQGAYAVWSPDSQCIAFSNAVGLSGGEVWAMRADGSNAVRLLSTPRDTYPFGWSPDGRFLFINRYGNGHSQFYAIRLSDGKEYRLSNTEEYHSAPALSADGKRIAFHSLRDYGYNLYLMDVRGLPPSEPNASHGDCLPSRPGK